MLIIKISFNYQQATTLEVLSSECCRLCLQYILLQQKQIKAKHNFSFFTVRGADSRCRHNSRNQLKKARHHGFLHPEFCQDNCATATNKQ